MTKTVRLRGKPRSAREAREFVRAALRQAHFAGDCELAVLLTSEVATNALRHGDSLTAIEVVVSDRRLHVETSDAEATEPVVCAVGPCATNGRGMALVESVADGWGVELTPGDGKTVWFDMSA